LDLYYKSASEEKRKEILNRMKQIIDENETSPFRTLFALRTYCKYINKDNLEETLNLYGFLKTMLIPSKNPHFNKNVKWYQSRVNVETEGFFFFF
jgi:hypothetical protein